MDEVINNIQDAIQGWLEVLTKAKNQIVSRKLLK